MAKEIAIAKNGARVVYEYANIARERSPRALSPSRRQGGQPPMFPDLDRSLITGYTKQFPNGGSLTVESERMIEALKNKEDEWEKYKKERDMAAVLARNGYKVVLRQDDTSGNTYDVTINGVKADLKKTKTSRH